MLLSRARTTDDIPNIPTTSGANMRDGPRDIVSLQDFSPSHRRNVNRAYTLGGNDATDLLPELVSDHRRRLSALNQAILMERNPDNSLDITLLNAAHNNLSTQTCLPVWCEKSLWVRSTCFSALSSYPLKTISLQDPPHLQPCRFDEENAALANPELRLNHREKAQLEVKSITCMMAALIDHVIQSRVHSLPTNLKLGEGSNTLLNMSRIEAVTLIISDNNGDFGAFFAFLPTSMGHADDRHMLKAQIAIVDRTTPGTRPVLGECEWRTLLDTWKCLNPEHVDYGAMRSKSRVSTIGGSRLDTLSAFVLNNMFKKLIHNLTTNFRGYGEGRIKVTPKNGYGEVFELHASHVFFTRFEDLIEHYDEQARREMCPGLIARLRTAAGDAATHLGKAAGNAATRLGEAAGDAATGLRAAASRLGEHSSIHHLPEMAVQYFGA